MTVCIVTFRNLVPPEVGNITITKTLAVFTYDDGSTYSDPPSGEPGDVNIPYGEAGLRSSQDKCVSKVFMFMVWTNGSGGNNSEDAGADSCWQRLGLDLAPARTVAKDTEKPGPHLQITTWDPTTGRDVEVSGTLPEEWKYLLGESDDERRIR